MLPQTLPPFFKARRETLMSKSESKGAAFILPSNPLYLRNPDVGYPFRQESNFFYLTGFEEPESCAVILPSNEGGKSHKLILFVRRRDPVLEIWEGERYGIEGALKVFGADETYLLSELEEKLPVLLKNVEKVFYRSNLNEADDRRIQGVLEKHRKAMGRSGRGLLPVEDPNTVIGEMRLFKTPEEIPFIRRACEVSALAHKTLMETVKPGMNEYEIEALMDYTCRKNGMQRMGYTSIVAGGENACCLHYIFNNQLLKDGDLVLVDAGGEYNYYGADITRTFPVGRTFSKHQATLYDLVLKAQKECVSLAKPGETMASIHRHASEVLVEGMLSLGLMKGKVDEIITSGQVKRFYPHGTGHWLGLDVHDVGLYQLNGEPRKLEPGMFFTIEPGFYVQPNDFEAPEHYRGIGIRIEDNVLITSQGCEVFTGAAPKERADIESLRK